MDPLSPLEIVLVEGDVRDPALDESMDFVKYAETRDPALIVEKAGMRAARFKLTKVNKPYLAEKIDGADSASEKFTLAFLAACHSRVDANGQAHRAETHTGAYGQRLAAIEWMVEVSEEYGHHAIYEIGLVARRIAVLPKGRSLRYV